MTWMFRWAIVVELDDLGRVLYAKPAYTSEDMRRIRARRKELEK